MKHLRGGLALIGLFISFNILLSSCGRESKTPDEVHHDFLAMNIDSSIAPGSDFFMFANNGWFSENPIPSTEQSNGLWQLIRDTINAQVREICENAAASTQAEKGSAKQKIGDMYYSGMDSVSINKAGISAIKAELGRIDAISNIRELAGVAAMIHRISSSPMFSFYVWADDMISTRHAIFIHQGGLTLPDRSFYVDTDERTVKIREQFIPYLESMFVTMGYDAASSKQAARDHMALETELAKFSRKTEDTRDPHKNYNKIPFHELDKHAPSFDWKVFMSEIGIGSPDTVIIGQPEVLKSWNKMLSNNRLPAWKNYLKIHLLKGLSPYLDDNTYRNHFAFFGTALRGTPQPKPRWKRVTEQTNSSLGELIGQVYVAEYLPKGTKEKLTEIGNAIKTVYGERIKQLDWMSEATKTKALEKLDAMIMKVGYPDKWKDMSSLQVDRTSYVRNVINANIWEMDYMVNKYGKPVDRNEWAMTPQTYNAYYNPSNNEIVVPASNIIVPGYERRLADDAILYSIIGGSTFGHEITHGFDDQGSKYDKNGNLNNWWTSEDSTRFFSKTRKIVEQYNQYVVVDSLTINGEMTQGENIADLGGVMIGYEAFKRTKQYRDKQVIAGLNPDQRFFLAYALAWMINERPESLASQVKSDVHSPAKFRVIGPLENMPEFHAAFGIKPGDKMWRSEEDRIKIW